MPDSTQERSRRLGHRADAPVPVSTYRVQLGAELTFADVADRLPYLERLGVTHVYLSPILDAAPGSTHFYDVVDHSRVSEVLGGVQGLRALAAQARRHGIGLIADIVPNHMAVPTPVYSNKALWSVLRHGPQSPYATWFDVDWSDADGVLMPVLGARLGAVLASDQLSLETMLIPGLEDEGEQTVLRYFEHLLPVREGTENLPMDALVTAQHYRLAYWRVANEELNYRRFFDVGSLVAVRVEDPEVFAATHDLIVSLVKEGVLDGLRVDHPDGLADPTGYIAQLYEACEGAWIVVEKILEDDEPFPTIWKSAGTTGYDASWRMGAVLRDPAGAAGLAGTLHHVAGDAMGDLPLMIEEAKRLVTKDSLAAEVRRLASLADDICRADVRLRDHTWSALHDCLTSLLISFGRYRAYVHPHRPAHAPSIEAIDHAAERARRALDAERHETLDVVVDLLKGREVGSAGKTYAAARLEFITRFQQVSGAVMAKGVEDTAYYRWTHLLPLCEVGSPAGRFAMPPTEFHSWCADFLATTPHALTTLTTHDTKRSEDVRARLGVLSELPSAWDKWVFDVMASTAELRPTELDGRTENLWWQTLVGTVSEDGSPMEWPRLEQYLTKAMREAKMHTSWTAVDSRYESAVLWFAQSTHADPTVRELVAAWTASTATGVRAAVLSQKLVQLTMPGVADTYQGCESLRPMLVDPDNRGTADFDDLAHRLALLDDGSAPSSLADEKLAVTAAALRLRKRHSEAFIGEAAGYQSLASTTGNVIAFARTVHGEPRVVVVAARAAIEAERLGGWQGHSVGLPEGTWRDVLTGRMLDASAAALTDVFATMPVALLERA